MLIFSKEVKVDIIKQKQKQLNAMYIAFPKILSNFIEWKFESISIEYVEMSNSTSFVANVSLNDMYVPCLHA